MLYCVVTEIEIVIVVLGWIFLHSMQTVGCNDVMPWCKVSHKFYLTQTENKNVCFVYVTQGITGKIRLPSGEGCNQLWFTNE